MTIPNNEILWVQYVNNGQITHIITSDIYRNNYFLYKVEDNKLVKTGKKNSNPLELEKFIKSI